jgi:hypothetical protein
MIRASVLLAWLICVPTELFWLAASVLTFTRPDLPATQILGLQDACRKWFVVECVIGVGIVVLSYQRTLFPVRRSGDRRVTEMRLVGNPFVGAALLMAVSYVAFCFAITLWQTANLTNGVWETWRHMGGGRRVTESEAIPIMWDAIRCYAALGACVTVLFGWLSCAVPIQGGPMIEKKDLDSSPKGSANA